MEDISQALDANKVLVFLTLHHLGVHISARHFKQMYWKHEFVVHISLTFVLKVITYMFARTHEFVRVLVTL